MGHPSAVETTRIISVGWKRSRLTATPQEATNQPSGAAKRILWWSACWIVDWNPWLMLQSHHPEQQQQQSLRRREKQNINNKKKMACPRNVDRPSWKTIVEYNGTTNPFAEQAQQYYISSTANGWFISAVQSLFYVSSSGLNSVISRPSITA